MVTDPGNPRDRLSRAIASRDDRALVAALHASTHHGKPGVTADTKRWVAREIARRDGDATDRLFDTARRLSQSDSPTVRSIACLLLTPFWITHRDEVLALAIALACDDDWEVREWSAGIFGSALDSDFDGEYATMRDLVGHPGSGVRRAIALAAMQAVRKERPERAEPLLALVEPLLTDPDDYVRKNLGPFALGDGLLRAYPEPTLAALGQWAERDDAMTRWNVAMACASGVALRHADRSLPIVLTLLSDDRRIVRGAVRTALRKHAGRGSDTARDALASLP